MNAREDVYHSLLWVSKGKFEGDDPQGTQIGGCRPRLEYNLFKMRAARRIRNHPGRVVRIGLVLGYPNKARAIVLFARPLAAIGGAGGHARLIWVVAGEAKHQDVFDQCKLDLQRGQLALEA